MEYTKDSGVPTRSELVRLSKLYRVSHLIVDLGFVDFDFVSCLTVGPLLPWQNVGASQIHVKSTQFATG